MANNFLQWNPAEANQETDAQYSSDAMRQGGAGNPSIFPSATANKLFYQLSTFVAGFAQALAAKGYSVTDVSLANLGAVLANVMTAADMSPYAPLASPALSGTPSAPTPAAADSTTKLATTAFVKSQGYQAALGFQPVQQGGGALQAANKVYLGWDGGAPRIQIDGNDLGQLALTSWVNAGFAPNVNPVISGVANFTTEAIIPGPPSTDSSTRVPNTAWVNTAIGVEATARNTAVVAEINARVAAVSTLAPLADFGVAAGAGSTYYMTAPYNATGAANVSMQIGEASLSASTTTVVMATSFAHAFAVVATVVGNSAASVAIGYPGPLNHFTASAFNQAGTAISCQISFLAIGF